MKAALRVENLRTVLDTATGTVRAVDGVDFELRRGECFALVGESGSGKSMTALSLMRLLPEAGRIASGRVALDGIELLALPEAAMRAVRGRRVAMVFQEPSTALNPVLSVGRQIVEVLERHAKRTAKENRQTAIGLLRAVGIQDAERRFEEYPFQLSGGLKQRAMIAAALAVDPEVLIADEPTTALDVTIQAQILHEVRKLCRDSGTALVWVTHDLAVLAGLADRIAVMYAGRIVESGSVADVLERPLHPYARGLIDSAPSRNRKGARLAQIPGMTPALTALPAGCPFRPRCPRSIGACANEVPVSEPAPGRTLRCVNPLAA